mmetsp:Transcript_48262/g.103048  ORF Transcript_48262/g.103048 Transcript_48262/m.103048 type:complete len:424 (+) Transcript_48262:1-1272(+)
MEGHSDGPPTRERSRVPTWAAHAREGGPTPRWPRRRAAQRARGRERTHLLSDDEVVDEGVEQVPRLAVLRLGELLVTEPAHGVQALALEDVAPVQDAVVVAEQHVARLHRHAHDVTLAHLLDVIQNVARDDRQVAEVHIRHAHLWHGAGAAVAQEARVVVEVAEPDRPLRLGVAVDGRLRVLDGLQTEVLSIGTPDHVEIHVELGGDGGVYHLAHLVHGLLLEVLRQGPEHVEVEVAHRDADLSIDERLQDLGVEIAEDGLAVGDEKLSARHRRRLEAHERARLGGLLESGLIVQADVVLGECLLVDLLVDAVAFGEELAQARCVDRVEARVELERLPEGAEARRILHEIKAFEPDGAVLREQISKLVLAVAEVRLAQRVGGIGSDHLDRARARLLGGILLLPVRDIQLVCVPHGRRTVGQGV